MWRRRTARCGTVAGAKTRHRSTTLCLRDRLGDVRYGALRLGRTGPLPPLGDQSVAHLPHDDGRPRDQRRNATAFGRAGVGLLDPFAHAARAHTRAHTHASAAATRPATYGMPLHVYSYTDGPSPQHATLHQLRRADVWTRRRPTRHGGGGHSWAATALTRRETACRTSGCRRACTRVRRVVGVERLAAGPNGSHWSGGVSMPHNA